MSDANAMFGDSSDSDSDGDGDHNTGDGQGDMRRRQQPEEVRARWAAVQNTVAFGGGRGLFALAPILKGSLVLSELPFVSWHKKGSSGEGRTGTGSQQSLTDPADLLAQVDAILATPAALAVCAQAAARNAPSSDPNTTHTRCLGELPHVLRDMLHVPTCAQLHPTALSHADEEEVERASTSLGLDRALDMDCSRLQVALALQHNGFGSGLYLQLAMVNHACHAPNCIKTSPTGATAWASELWTTRDVRAGEQLFISYAQPLEELSGPQLSDFLWTHHRFRCDPATCRVHAGRSNIVDTVGAAGAIGRGVAAVAATVSTATAAVALECSDREGEHEDTPSYAWLESFASECDELVSPPGSASLAGLVEAVGQADRLLEEIERGGRGLPEQARSGIDAARRVTLLHRLGRDLAAEALGGLVHARSATEEMAQTLLAQAFIRHSWGWLAGVDAASAAASAAAAGTVAGGATEKRRVGHVESELAEVWKQGFADPHLVGHLEALADCLVSTGGAAAHVSMLRIRASALRHTFSMRVRYPAAARVLMNAPPGTCYWGAQAADSSA